jgi:hypothetical protein
MSRQSAHERGKVLSPTHRPLLPPGNISGTPFYCGPGSSVGIATDYGLDGPGIESVSNELCYKPVTQSSS